jgi:hypothetical protein
MSTALRKLDAVPFKSMLVIPNSQEYRASIPWFTVERSNNANHRFQLVSAAINHVARHRENDYEPDIGDPALRLD